MRVRAAAIISQDARILLLKYRYGGKDVYNLPGGNPDAGESLPACVQRELLEELNIHVDAQQLAVVAQGVGQRAGKLDSVLHTVFQGKILSGEVKINPEQTSALEAVWIPFDELEKIILYPAINEQLAKIGKEAISETVFVEKFEQIWY